MTTARHRQAFFDALAEATAASERAGRSLALLLVDIRRFREINATYGYEVGDELLERFGERLRGVLREADQLTRIGGDQFAVTLPAIMNSGHAVLAATKLVECLEELFLIDGMHVKAQPTIGVALYPDHARTPTALLQRAEAALFHAKSGRTAYAIYDSGQGVSSVKIEHELHQAIENGDLTLYCQPQVDLRSGRVSGVESLVRWQHPADGLVLPDHFIPVAEDSGLIIPLTLWTLNAALRHCAEHKPAGGGWSMAVNFSARCLYYPGVAELVERAMKIWDTAPGTLTVEVTESAMMADPEQSLRTLEELDALGVAVAIDDFGTGYSSLACLKRLPVKELKIDKSFIMGMVHDADDATIARSTIDLAHNFGLVVTAEGVENRETLDALTAMGCDYAQGYYVSWPLPAADVPRWLRESPWGRFAQSAGSPDTTEAP
ncbi:MAG: bifunctional diguanylate cyclase/phosphodiesterase [Gammaproteobacteria bacterium]|nr:bifunctional diguanylate cyclase/phosphodiesterase [Gammaproteobacteria bacterium]